MKKLLAILSLFFCMTVTLMAQQVVTTWLSDAVVPGEQTRLFIILTDGSIARQDPLPRVKGASLVWTCPKEALSPEHGLIWCRETG